MAQLDEGKQYWTLLDPNSKGCRQRIRPSGGASSRAAYIILAVLRLARISLTSIRGFDKWRPWFATSTSHARRVDEMHGVAQGLLSCRSESIYDLSQLTLLSRLDNEDWKTKSKSAC